MKAKRFCGQERAPGDLLYVSGTLGEAEYGLRLLRKNAGRVNPKNAAMRKHLYPEPRVELGRWLAEKKLGHRDDGYFRWIIHGLAALVCRERRWRAGRSGENFRRHTALNRESARQLALHGGDDYELLFSVSPARASLLPAKFRGLRLTKIGEIAAGRGVRIIGKNGKPEPLRAAGWDPFRQKSR